jgi:hypothetical protein
MTRERSLQIAMAVVGLFFTAAFVFPVATVLWQKDQPSYESAMGFSLYVTLGIMLLIAVRRPAEHRSLISFAIWSSFGHAAVMLVMVIRDERARGEWLAVVIFTTIGLTLLALTPKKQAADKASAASA